MLEVRSKEIGQFVKIYTKVATKKTVAIDFDGVIHSYKQGWTGPVPEDPPVDGALDFIHFLEKKGYEVVIFSSRAKTKEGVEGTEKWLSEHGFPKLDVRHEKPEALLYIDDRGFRFTGVWDDLKEFINSGFKSWVE